MKRILILAAAVALATFVACGGDSTKTESVALSPNAPSGGGTGGGTVALTAPTPETPTGDTLLSTLRPTLTVRNGTSTQSSGTRTYEFQVSDNSGFTSTGMTFSFYYAVVVNKTGVTEGTNGSTSFTVEADLQPATRFYWRARMTQGTVTSDWSSSAQFRTKVTGYNRPGELYDPLIDETLGTRVGNTTFVTGKGLQIVDANSWVRYQLGQTLTSGEFSVDVENLSPGNPQSKARIFSMMDGGNNLFTSNYLYNVQYRGAAGNPDNCISFKALWGGEAYKLEPDFARRAASVMNLSPTKTYLWKSTWGTGIRLTIYDGGSSNTGVGGTQIYDYQIVSPGGSYAPSPHTAYLGANNGPFGQESGSFPGAIYRNLWVGNRPRPTSLGSALEPPPIDVR